jgi:hypothetical protein
MLSFMRRHKIFTGIVLTPLVLFAFLFVFVFSYVWYMSYGPHRDYEIDFTLPASAAAFTGGDLEVGMAIRDVTPNPDNYDTWEDVSGNGQFNEGVDTYVDRTGSGTFDLVWLAGFGINRPMKEINDPLWSRAVAFRANDVTIAMVAIDSVGLCWDRVVNMRKLIEAENPDIDHVVIHSTHTHNAPDTMGIWSYWFLWGSRFDHDYIRMIEEQTRDAVLEAVENLRPAETIIANAYVPSENFARDSRPPYIYDHQMPLAWFRDKETGEPIGTIASWGMHPEAIGARNILSSDFCHYFREAMENGLEGPGAFEGFGGHSIFFSGPLGGLMTQLGMPITDRFGVTVERDSVEKAKAQGENLAILAAEALRGPDAKVMEDTRLAVAAKTMYAAVGWPFKAALYLGVVHPGVYNGNAKSELNALRIGEIGVVTIPGEIFPEIVDGGVESPEGADFPGDPVEVPPLREAMSGTIVMVPNLTNDQIGYIVPKTQWDQKAPYTYGRNSAPYGEIYTGNPEIAPSIHQGSMEMIRRINELFGEPTPSAK